MKSTTVTHDYHGSIRATISPKEAVKNICRVSAWWTANFEGSAERVNDIFTVRFGETFATFKIIEVIPDNKIVWWVTDCNLHWLKDKKEWKNTRIVWDISSANGETQIDMTHIGLVPGVECYENCETGWNHYLKESLLKLLTEKVGLPEPRNTGTKG